MCIRWRRSINISCVPWRRRRRGGGAFLGAALARPEFVARGCPAHAKAPRVGGDGVRPIRKAWRPAAARLGHGQALGRTGNKQRRLSGQALFWMPSEPIKITPEVPARQRSAAWRRPEAGDRSAASLAPVRVDPGCPIVWLPRPTRPAGLSLVLLPGRARPPGSGPRAPHGSQHRLPQRCPSGARPRPKTCTL